MTKLLDQMLRRNTLDLGELARVLKELLTRDPTVEKFKNRLTIQQRMQFLGF